jgi:regulator of protease activity HflC (stomatin/prohibitin superfamily)
MSKLKEKPMSNEDKMVAFVKKVVITALCAIFGLILVFSSFTIIPTGYTGVRVTMGQVDDSIVQNGFNFKIPIFQKIVKINNKQQDMTITDVISAETSERNEIYFSDVTITYSISPEKSSWIYANVSNYDNNLINSSLVGSALKSVSKTLTPTDATNRLILEPLAKDAVQESIDGKYGEGVVTVYKVVISQATFDEAYNAKIAQKQEAQMAYETQQIENKKNVEQAEAEAKAQLAKAQASADASIIAAQADAEVAKISADSAEYQGQKDAAIMSNLGEMLKQYPDLVYYYYVTNWDGKLPEFVGGDSNDIILDMNDFNK